VCKTLELKTDDTSYSEIMQRLVKRYLFKLERARDEKDSGKYCMYFRYLVNGISIRHFY